MAGRRAVRHRAAPRRPGRRRLALLGGGTALLLGGLAVLAPSWLPPDRTQGPAAAAVPVVVAPPAPPAPVPTPAPTATADTGLVRSAPVRLQVDSIGVDSELVDLGLAADGTVEVPEEGFPAGWFTGAPTPGQTGPAVLVGHVDWDGAPGVFYRLRDLEPGAEVAVTRADGDVAVFAVTQVDQFAKDDFPTEDVYGDLDHAGLRLITCGGSFDDDSGHYVDNLVAYAELVRVVSP
ncbi:class F sortase [Aquipuribacter sp. MA13-6]|uniref:class F sortase n=1 Tax=unclassified Aquipuribacter TaxID=2635084 RepID=UPI003EEF119E